MRTRSLQKRQAYSSGPPSWLSGRQHQAKISDTKEELEWKELLRRDASHSKSFSLWAA